MTGHGGVLIATSPERCTTVPSQSSTLSGFTALAALWRNPETLFAQGIRPQPYVFKLAAFIPDILVQEVQGQGQPCLFGPHTVQLLKGWHLVHASTMNAL